jgi:hypothetical protein
VCWSVSTSSWSRLSELGIEHTKSSTTYFDSILTSSIVGTIIARISWMLLNLSVYQEVPWGILPYSRSATEFIWFTVFPWRLFRITEGIFYPALWIIMGIIVIFSVFFPTVQLARKLRLEKRGIMRSFVLKNAACAIIVAGYFALLTYFVR